MKGTINRLLLLVSILLWSQPGNLTRAQRAYILTDENFEHDTQATTGSTTGDWLILFCEFERFPKKCHGYMDFWNELAGVLRGKTTVAQVNL